MHFHIWIFLDTALPSEVHNGNTSSLISSNRSSPLSLYQHQSLNTSSSNSPFHPSQYPISTYNRIPSAISTTTNPDLAQSNQETGPQPNSSQHGSAPQANSEATRNHPQTNVSDDTTNSSNSRSNTTNNAAQTARIVSQNVNGTCKYILNSFTVIVVIPLFPLYLLFMLIIIENTELAERAFFSSKCYVFFSNFQFYSYFLQNRVFFSQKVDYVCSWKDSSSRKYCENFLVKKWRKKVQLSSLNFVLRKALSKVNNSRRMFWRGFCCENWRGKHQPKNAVETWNVTDFINMKRSRHTIHISSKDISRLQPFVT